MVRGLLILFFLFCGDKLDLREPFLERPKLYPSKHHFNEVYAHIRSHEGNYVFHINDRGGETYGGIARRMHPQWGGWYILDKIKNKQRHDSIPEVEYYVKDWYLTLWVRGGFERIDDFELALNLFDFSIHSSPRTVELKVNRILAKYGCEAIKVGEDWIPYYINTLPPREVVLWLKIERLKLFNYLVRKDPSQMVFIKGWYKRLENI